MIERVLEPEAIDTMADPLEYDSMDFSEGNAAFAEKALELLPDSLLHHIPDPTQVLIEINWVAKPNAVILVRDLIRPTTNSHVEVFVELYTGDCDDYRKKLYRDSLTAAFTISEVEKLVRTSELKNVRVVQSSDRHWSIEKDYSRQS